MNWHENKYVKDKNECVRFFFLLFKSVLQLRSIVIIENECQKIKISRVCRDKRACRHIYSKRKLMIALIVRLHNHTKNYSSFIETVNCYSSYDINHNHK
jgi:hypothetical protein